MLATILVSGLVSLTVSLILARIMAKEMVKMLGEIESAEKAHREDLLNIAVDAISRMKNGGSA
ncbi:hypothetical protein NIA71_08310 [Ihubacter massiliensis]|uniref:hypothetical protein n=1 Tax=Ihubacter massiliensis TaxID=1852367 RepID=UPI002096EB9C|nr:hypothetical protein [Ihubacter massiliensis]MCO7121952.1 hypothetical protein [Ihubacter massiliensis]